MSEQPDGGDEPPEPEPDDTPTSEELDVEGPNESAPGHEPQPESDAPNAE